MANTEADLDKDSGVSRGTYLDNLLERGPSVDSLLMHIKELPVFSGFLVSVPSDESIYPDSLSKSELLKVLDPSVVDWNDLYTNILHGIYDHRATSKHSSATRNKLRTNFRFDLYHRLARKFPSSLSSASQV